MKLSFNKKQPLQLTHKNTLSQTHAESYSSQQGNRLVKTFIGKQPSTVGNANPAHIIFAVPYLDMHFTSIKILVPNRKVYMDFLISSQQNTTH